MCGIVGLVGNPDATTVLSMRDALKHRGPDDCGHHLDGRVGLGFRRLSIIDLEDGNQPMSNDDQSLILIHNGEIYNYLELRSQLQSKGYRFHTQSDTETILCAYQEYGFDCLAHLDGMFAFVIYDRRHHRLFGARDRLGKKPLYYTARGFGTGPAAVDFAFASELKALLRHPSIGDSLAVCRDGLVSYLVNDYVAGELSIHEGIAKLPAAHAFAFGLEGSSEPGLRTWRYWDLNFAESQDRPGLDEAAAEVLRLMERAVERRLMSDVPLGVLLSGGLDSSTLVALMAKLRPSREIKTFSIGFDVPSFDESTHAERIARHFNTEHRVRMFAASDMPARVSSVIATLDEPFADPSILPVAMLSEFAREYVTVALGGDGGDEIFAGYDPFRAIAAASWYRSLVPSFAHRYLIEPLAGLIPVTDRNMGLSFKVKRFLRGARSEPRLRSATWMGPFTLGQLERLAPELVAGISEQTVHRQALSSKHPRSRNQELTCALEFFQRQYLPDDILVKVDRASMLHSLEVRAPFLDRALVEYVNRLPNHYKLRGGVTKYLLRRIALGGDGNPLLPSFTLQRKKKGFGIPVARWIRQDLRESFRNTLLGEWPRELAMFDKNEIERLLVRHLGGRENHYKELWALYVLAMWKRHH